MKLTKTDFIQLENLVTRLNGFIKSIGDAETIENIKKLDYIMAELRHAAVNLDGGQNTNEVLTRIKENIFNN